MIEQLSASAVVLSGEQVPQPQVVVAVGEVAVDQAVPEPAKPRLNGTQRFRRVANDPVNAYLDDAGETPLLTASEEVELAKAIELGGYAEDLLNLRNPQTCQAAQKALLKGLEIRAKMLVESRQPKEERKQPAINLKRVKKAALKEIPKTDTKKRDLPYEPGTETEQGRQDTVEALTLYAQGLPDHVVLELKKAVAQGEQARARFIRANLLLGAAMAKRYLYRGLDAEELLQVSAVGVAKAVDKFDYKTGLRFSTYAPWWIRHHLVNALNKTARPVRYPADVETMMSRIRVTANDLRTSLGHEPDPQEIADALNEQKKGQRGKPRKRSPGITAERVQELISLDRVPVYLDEPISDEPGSADRYVGIASVQPTVEEQVEYSELERVVARALERLSEQDQEIAQMFFGLHPYTHEHGQEEIARNLGLNRKTVRASIDRTRRKLAATPELAALAS